jgi:cytochrome c
MDSFELNKILGAILGTCLVTLALNIASGAIFAPEKPAKPGYDIVVPEKAAEGAKAKPAEPEKPLPVLLASADPKKGANDAKKCTVCHTLGKGEPNRIGPNLWGIVDRPRASEAGFNYSDAMKKKGGTWTPEQIFEFIVSPQKDIPGTRMTFAGIPSATQRADVIAYLNTLSDNPKPLPTAAEAKPPAPTANAGKPADAGKPAPAPAAKPAAPAAGAPAAKPATPAPANPPAK